MKDIQVLGGYKFYCLEDNGVVQFRQGIGAGFTNRLRIGKIEVPTVYGKTIALWGSQEAQCNGMGTNPPWFILRNDVFESEDYLLAHHLGEVRPPKKPKRKPVIPQGLTQEELAAMGVVFPAK